MLSDAETRHLLPIVYVFKPEQNPKQVVPTSLLDAVQYWTSQDKLQVITQHQDWLVIALREKGDGISSDGWGSRYDEAIAAMRSAAINVPLAIDTPNSNSEAQLKTLLELGPARINNDNPLHNVLLNVNTGAENDSGAALVDAINSAAASDALPPMIFGEISGFMHKSDYTCGEPYDYEGVLVAAQAKHLGWLAWSWGSASNQYCPQLNMTNGGNFGDWNGDWAEKMVLNNDFGISTAHAISYTPGQACQ
jgi:hypothetical protein